MPAKPTSRTRAVSTCVEGQRRWPVISNPDLQVAHGDDILMVDVKIGLQQPSHIVRTSALSTSISPSKGW